MYHLSATVGDAARPGARWRRLPAALREAALARGAASAASGAAGAPVGVAAAAAADVPAAADATAAAAVAAAARGASAAAAAAAVAAAAAAVATERALAVSAVAALAPAAVAVSVGAAAAAAVAAAAAAAISTAAAAAAAPAAAAAALHAAPLEEAAVLVAPAAPAAAHRVKVLLSRQLAGRRQADAALVQLRNLGHELGAHGHGHVERGAWGGPKNGARRRVSRGRCRATQEAARRGRQPKHRGTTAPAPPGDSPHSSGPSSMRMRPTAEALCLLSSSSLPTMALQGRGVWGWAGRGV